MKREFIPGIVEGLPIDEYHGLPSVSKSGLDLLNISPAHFYAFNLDPNRPPQKQRAGQLEGNLAHCAILEPDAFDDRYVVGPDVSRATKEWKEFAESVPKGVVVIKPDQYEAAMRQADAVRSLPEIQRYLSRGAAEQSAFWIDPITGVQCRCRPDFVHPIDEESAVILDVKTYASADADEFRKQAARKRYHVQDTFYSAGYSEAAGVEVVKFIFVVVETDWPYAAASYSLGTESREEGFMDWRRLLDVYEECLRLKRWPGYADKTTEIDLPPYAFTSQEVEISYV